MRGPSFYQFDNSAAPNETIYTSSGMAAISALLLASVRLMSEADILVLPGSYGETLELIESYARQLRLVRLKRSPGSLKTRCTTLVPMPSFLPIFRMPWPFSRASNAF